MPRAYGDTIDGGIGVDNVKLLGLGRGIRSTVSPSSSKCNWKRLKYEADAHKRENATWLSWHTECDGINCKNCSEKHRRPTVNVENRYSRTDLGFEETFDQHQFLIVPLILARTCILCTHSDLVG